MLSDTEAGCVLENEEAHMDGVVKKKKRNEYTNENLLKDKD
jgi:hypothetical protein